MWAHGRFLVGGRPAGPEIVPAARQNSKRRLKWSQIFPANAILRVPRGDFSFSTYRLGQGLPAVSEFTAKTQPIDRITPLVQQGLKSFERQSRFSLARRRGDYLTAHFVSITSIIHAQQDPSDSEHDDSNNAKRQWVSR